MQGGREGAELDPVPRREGWHASRARVDPTIGP